MTMSWYVLVSLCSCLALLSARGVLCSRRSSACSSSLGPAEDDGWLMMTMAIAGPRPTIYDGGLEGIDIIPHLRGTYARLQAQAWPSTYTHTRAPRATHHAPSQLRTLREGYLRYRWFCSPPPARSYGRHAGGPTLYHVGDTRDILQRGRSASPIAASFWE